MSRPTLSVQTYWLLLAISQDYPKEAHVASLRDRCEQAALEGHWDLPFKNTKLPAPLSSRGGGHPRFFRRHSSRGDETEGATSPIALTSGPPRLATPSTRGSLVADPPRGGSPDPIPRLSQWRSGALSPEVPSRAISPDGLGDGIYSSVFMDAGVEGLIYESGTQTDMGKRRREFEGASHRDRDHGYGYAEESGSEASTPLQPHSGGGRRGRAFGRETVSEDGENLPFPFSPPNSPKKRETTFGATLDFVDALCMASSNLTAFQRE